MECNICFKGYTQLAKTCPLAVFLLLAGTATLCAADEGPKPIPATRPEMKAALEALKDRTPRLPLARPEGEEGGRGTVHNGLARRLYLPREWYAADFRSSPGMTLDYVFKVQLFWIASRANNCQYCLGHQEKKLAMAGQTEDQIATLDFDWSPFPPGQQAVFALAKKMTLAPHKVGPEDVAALKPHFTDPQIVEIVYTVASYNSVNRWTDSLGLPQDQAFRQEAINFVTPTPQRFTQLTTMVAPLELKPRPPLETPREVELALRVAASREPAVAIPDLQTARERVGSEWPHEVLPNWIRALGYFSFPDGGYATALRAVEEGGSLKPALKARLFWTTARHNRAWYSLDTAIRRYEKLGVPVEDVYALESESGDADDAETLAARFAEMLTVSPQLIADADILDLRERFSDDQVAQIVYVVCTANMFDRLTETLHLPLDPPGGK